MTDEADDLVLERRGAILVIRLNRPERLLERQPVVFDGEDAREGAVAFVERRDPVWKGR